MGQEAKDVFDVQAEVADGVSSAFPEGQTVVGVVVEGASNCDLVESVMVEFVMVGFVMVEFVMVEFVMVAAVVVVVEGMSSLGFGRFGSERGGERGADVLGVVQEAADIYVIAATKIAVIGVDCAESEVQRKERNV